LGITTKAIPRAENSEANELVQATAQSLPLPLDVFYEILHQSSTSLEPKYLILINAIKGADWHAPIIAFLKGHFEPESK
jgi:hypothetical protein